MFVFSKRSLDRLIGVHPDLVRVVRRALELSPVDFAITEGVRTKAKQAEYYAKGKSKTLNSRHLTGHAVDVAAHVNGEISWDLGYYKKIAEAFKRAASESNTQITWGGDWEFVDGPHFELSRSQYP